MTQHRSLEGRDRVVEIIVQMQRELEAGEEWENDTLERFLDGLQALLGSIENTYTNVGDEVPENPWVIIGDTLLGTRYYE